MNHISRARKGSVRAMRRAGFTLIEILAVILIIGILASYVVPEVMSSIGKARATACAKNLEQIKRGFLEYEITYKRIPEESGVSFFACLITDKVWQPSAKSGQTLTCPEVQRSFLDPGAEGLPIEDWFIPANRESIDGNWSAYAGRDLKRARLRGFKGAGKTALVADDNDGAGNHSTTTNVLWDDLDVRSLELVVEHTVAAVINLVLYLETLYLI